MKYCKMFIILLLCFSDKIKGIKEINSNMRDAIIINPYKKNVLQEKRNIYSKSLTESSKNEKPSTTIYITTNDNSSDSLEISDRTSIHNNTYNITDIAIDTTNSINIPFVKLKYKRNSIMHTKYHVKYQIEREKFLDEIFASFDGSSDVIFKGEKQVNHASETLKIDFENDNPHIKHRNRRHIEKEVKKNTEYQTIKRFKRGNTRFRNNEIKWNVDDLTVSEEWLSKEETQKERDANNIITHRFTTLARIFNSFPPVFCLIFCPLCCYCCHCVYTKTVQCLCISCMSTSTTTRVLMKKYCVGLRRNEDGTYEWGEITDEEKTAMYAVYRDVGMLNLNFEIWDENLAVPNSLFDMLAAEESKGFMERVKTYL